MTILAAIMLIVDLLYKLAIVTLAGAFVAYIIILRIERKEAREALSRINNRTEKRREEEKNDSERLPERHS